MLLKIFTRMIELIIGDLPDDKKKRAWELFTELAGIIAKNAAEGAMSNAKNDL